MTIMKKHVFILVLASLAGCSGKKESGRGFDVAAYKQEIEQWHIERVKNLQGPGGWLNVAGLYWLKEGINSFGGDGSNDITFPAGKITAKAGFFLLRNGVVTAEITPGVTVTSGDAPFTRGVLFHPDSSRNPSLESGSLRWFVIKRDTKHGIRLRDFESDALKAFKGIDRFPVNPGMRLTASWEEAPKGRTIPVTNILGQTTPQDSPGTLIFIIEEVTFQLDVIDEGGDEYFVIFGDDTNTKETYGAGRYLYVKKPDTAGHTTIDFNKAYNPPCAFTEYATCPLPPKQNILPVSILAGEKNYEHHQ